MNIARARNTDPETSHAAAASLSEEALKRSMRDVLFVMKFYGGSQTNEELVVHYNRLREHGVDLVEQTDQGIRSRRKQLGDAGLCRDSGVRKPTGRNGRSCVVWELTDAAF